MTRAQRSKWVPRAFLVAGVLGVLGFAGFVACLTIFGPRVRVVIDVSYERLLANDLEPAETFARLERAETELLRAIDPANEANPAIPLRPGQRLVQFDLVIALFKNAHDHPIKADKFKLVDEMGAGYRPVQVAVDGIPIDEPARLKRGEATPVTIVFELPATVDPVELRYDSIVYFSFQPNYQTVVYEFQ